MQTRTADLMALFDRLFSNSTTVDVGSCASTIQLPDPALSAPPVPLKNILSVDGSVLTKVLDQHATHTDPDRAKEFTELSILIAKSEGDFDEVNDCAKRFLDFVYPVV